MFHRCKYSITWVLVFFIFPTNSSRTTSDALSCQVQRRCSDFEETVWVTDGRECLVIRNACILANMNCERRDRCETILEPISQGECQKLCRRACTREYRPVCTEYKNALRTFSNACTWRSHACRYGQSYMLVSQGECTST